MDGGTMTQAVQDAVQQGGQTPGQVVQFIWWLALVFAFSLVFTVVFIRALPWSEATKAKKPLACDACMTGWAAIGFSLGLTVLFGVSALPLLALHMLPAAGLCLMLLAVMSYWKPTPPTL